MSLKFNHLCSFVVVADEGNQSRAAVRLHLSQPALSRRIRELEQELKFELFERVGRNIRLTGRGEEFLGHCRDIVARTNALQERAEALESGDAGILRVGASSPILDMFFPHILARYVEVQPQVQVQLVENGSIELLDQLERGEVHLAVSSFPTDDRLQGEILGVIPILAAMAPSNRLSASDPVEVNELADQSLLLLRTGFYTRDTFDAACRFAHVQPRISFESDSPQTLLALAEVDFGIAVVPATVRLDSHELSVRPIMRAGTLLEKRISINWDRRRHQPPYAEAFIRTAAKCIRERLLLEFSTDSDMTETKFGQQTVAAHGS